MRRLPHAALLLLAALLPTACAGPDVGSTPAPTGLDEAAYLRDVHPILEARCGTLDCHGSVDRPLRLYAETGLRARDELRGVALPAPITAEELAENVAALAAVDAPATIDESLILEKALDLVKHTGKAVWTGVDDPQYVCVRAWLAGETAPAACALAAEQVKLPPPLP